MLLSLCYILNMIKTNVFTKKYKEDVWSIYPAIADSIEKAFEHDTNYLHQGEGKLISSLHNSALSDQWLFEIPELQECLFWIKEQFIEASLQIYGKQWEDVSWHRVWTNQMSYGSSITEHNHHFSGLVGVFYLNAPEGSSKLIVNGFRFLPQAGDLVIHDGNAAHWVSTHQSNIPRVVIVLEASEKIKE